MTDAMFPTPPHWATSQPPGRRTAARFAKRASWSGTQWNVAVERMASTGPVERQRSTQVGNDVFDPIAERGQAVAGGVDHRRRTVERHDVATRQPGREELGDAARPAPGVEHAFVADQRQPIEDDRTPAGHRVGDPVVGHGIPVARHGRPLSRWIGVGRRSRCRGDGCRCRRGRATPGTRSPYHDKADPTTSSTAQMSIARRKASIEARFEATICGRGCARPRRVERLEGLADGRVGVSSPVATPSDA